MRDLETVRVAILKAAFEQDPDAQVVGDVTATELARAVAKQVMTCPACGAEAWVNIDCALCNLVGSLYE